MRIGAFTRKTARAVKARIVAGESLVAIAADFNVTYMAIYKIAIGASWSRVEPRGRLIPERGEKTTRSIPPKKCQALALLKIRTPITNNELAARLGVSASTVSRAIDAGRIMLGLQLRKRTYRGTLAAAQTKLGLTDDEVADLITVASKKRLPRWIKRAVNE